MAVVFETLRGMKPGALKFFFAAATGLFFLAATGARAQSMPLDSLGVATNFSSVTYFEPPHEQQVETRLTSVEAASLPGTLFDLKKMKVEQFNADGKLELVVEAPQCIYAPLDEVASSAGHLALNSGDGKFHVEGDGFLWTQTNSVLVISNHVRTVIEGTLAGPANL
jgi:hypothetical protein